MRRAPRIGRPIATQKPRARAGEQCPAFFPGPVWLLVPRNGEEPPYAYGYL